MLPFENSIDGTSHTGYYLPKVKITDYNLMVHGRRFFNWPIKNQIKTYDNIRKIAIGHGIDYATYLYLIIRILKKIIS